MRSILTIKAMGMWKMSNAKESGVGCGDEKSRGWRNVEISEDVMRRVVM